MATVVYEPRAGTPPIDTRLQSIQCVGQFPLSPSAARDLKPRAVSNVLKLISSSLCIRSFFHPSGRAIWVPPELNPMAVI